MYHEYYVILDRIHLNFMNNGTIVGIENAEKFKSYELAAEELKNYDEDFEGAIYKVTEKMFRDFELVEESEKKQMSKIYKSWELMKAIADGKINSGSKFIFKTEHNMKEEVLWDGEVFLYVNSEKTIASDYTDIRLIQGTFELIKESEEK